MFGQDLNTMAYEVYDSGGSVAGYNIVDASTGEFLYAGDMSGNVFSTPIAPSEGTLSQPVYTTPYTAPYSTPAPSSGGSFWDSLLSGISKIAQPVLQYMTATELAQKGIYVPQGATYGINQAGQRVAITKPATSGITTNTLLLIGGGVLLFLVISKRPKSAPARTYTKKAR